MKPAEESPLQAVGSTHSAVNGQNARRRFVSSELIQQLGDSQLGIIASKGVSNPVGNEFNLLSIISVFDS